MRMSVRLSKRMDCVAGMVTPGGCVCDVGCDHGFVSIYLVQHRIAKKVLAMDVKEGPLERARSHIAAYGLDSQIETRLSDGLSMITENDLVNTAVIAGMGGLLIEKIISQALERGLIIKEYVLQPQSGWDKLRSFLRRHDFQIICEDMIEEDGKYYQVLKVSAEKMADRGALQISDAMLFADDGKEPQTWETGHASEQQVRDLYGGILLDMQHPVLFSYLQKEHAKFMEIKRGMEKQQQDDSAIASQLAIIEKALAYYGSRDKRS